MDFELNERYTRPPNSTPRWYFEALGHIRQIRLPPVRIRLENTSGGTIDDALEGVDEGPEHNPFGVVELESGYGVPCEDVAAFTLLGDPPIDTSDELRGGR